MSRACAALGVVVVVAALLLEGCGNARSPIEPTPTTVTPPARVFSFSGAVSDTASRPVAGATVEVTSGARAGTAATTDEAGRFSMPGTFVDSVTVTASREGYLPSTRTVPPRPSQLLPPPTEGERWEAYIQLEPLAPSPNIAGVYSLTLTADPVCTNLPDEARRRSYTATIAPASPGSRTSFLATMSDTRFFSLVPCPAGQVLETCTYNRIGIGIAGNYARLSVGMVERLSDTTTLAFVAGAGGAFSEAGIALRLSGSFLYCPGEPYLIDQGTWSCRAGGAVDCESDNHQLTLVRR